MGKIITLNEAKQIRKSAKYNEKLVVFTNGCFDLLHKGHIDLLRKAKLMGDILFVAVNSDNSVRSLKGKERPYITDTDRAILLAAIVYVDYVLIFEELTPANLIECLFPDVLVKGEDWSIENIVGRETVINLGGKVLSIEKKFPEYSTSNLAQKIAYTTTISTEYVENKIDETPLNSCHSWASLISSRLHDSALIKLKISHLFIEQISQAVQMIVSALCQSNKILLCGNGGSAADAQHLAAEFVGRFEDEKDGFSAIALTADTSVLTALANDYGYENVFSKQVKAIARKGDVLIGISTNGLSKNINKAVKTARHLGLSTIGLSGNQGGSLATLVDCAIVVPSINMARIQEAHITVGHIICELVEAEMLKKKGY